MTGKSAGLYGEVFRYIEESVFSLSPTHFLTDFEGGMRKAINIRWRNASLHGCWYHYSAALRRKLKATRVLSVITGDPKANAIYKKMLCLPLLPDEHIQTEYSRIKEEAQKSKLSITFQTFFQYFDSFWLNLVSLL